MNTFNIFSLPTMVIAKVGSLVWALPPPLWSLGPFILRFYMPSTNETSFTCLSFQIFIYFTHLPIMPLFLAWKTISVVYTDHSLSYGRFLFRQYRSFYDPLGHLYFGFYAWTYMVCRQHLGFYNHPVAFTSALLAFVQAIFFLLSHLGLITSEVHAFLKINSRHRVSNTYLARVSIWH